jgi:hypothetical protein
MNMTFSLMLTGAHNTIDLEKDLEALDNMYFTPSADFHRARFPGEPNLLQLCHMCW